ncbi:MAG: ferrous iron transport protein A [Planctomycetota bacterium]
MDHISELKWESARDSLGTRGPAAARGVSAAGPRATRAVRLAELPAGARATLHDDDLDEPDRALVRAMGLTERSDLRICRQGEPCIVQVERTRVGLSRGLARRIFALPHPPANLRSA